jgi:hypothetical protein
VALIYGESTGELGDRFHTRRDCRERGPVRLQISFIPCKKKSALPGLRVLCTGQQSIDGGDGFLRVHDLLVVFFDRSDVQESYKATDNEESDNGSEREGRPFVHTEFARQGRAGLR